MIRRRAFLSRLGVLAVGGGALWLVRDRLPWPPLQPRFADGRATPWLPMTPGGELLEIAVAVNGQPVRAVVDTGAQFSAIDRGLAQSLGLERTLAAPVLAYGVSGGPSLTHTVRFDLAAPGLFVEGVRAAALDLAGLSAVTGRAFRLLIGRDVLRRLTFEADFPRRRLRFLDPQRVRPAGRDRVVALGRRSGAPVLPVVVESRPPLDVLLDTGATGVLSLSAAAARDLGLLAPGRQVSSAHSVSLGGLSLDRVVRVASVRAAGLTRENVEVQIYEPATTAPAPAGLLGSGLFQGQRILVDLGGDRLILAEPDLMVVRPPR